MLNHVLLKSNAVLLRHNHVAIGSSGDPCCGSCGSGPLSGCNHFGSAPPGSLTLSFSGISLCASCAISAHGGEGWAFLFCNGGANGSFCLSPATDAHGNPYFLANVQNALLFNYYHATLGAGSICADHAACLSLFDTLSIAAALVDGSLQVWMVLCDRPLGASIVLNLDGSHRLVMDGGTLLNQYSPAIPLFRGTFTCGYDNETAANQLSASGLGAEVEYPTIPAMAGGGRVSVYAGCALGESYESVNPDACFCPPPSSEAMLPSGSSQSSSSESSSSESSSSSSSGGAPCSCPSDWQTIYASTYTLDPAPVIDDCDGDSADESNPDFDGLLQSNSESGSCTWTPDTSNLQQISGQIVYYSLTLGTDNLGNCAWILDFSDQDGTRYWRGYNTSAAPDDATFTLDTGCAGGPAQITLTASNPMP